MHSRPSHFLAVINYGLKLLRGKRAKKVDSAGLTRLAQKQRAGTESRNREQEQRAGTESRNREQEQRAGTESRNREQEQRAGTERRNREEDREEKQRGGQKRRPEKGLSKGLSRYRTKKPGQDSVKKGNTSG
jgi:hypothetical protein